MTIKDQFAGLIADAAPGHKGRCSLTVKRRREMEKIFFAGYRCCLAKIMLDLTGDDAEQKLEALFKEVEAGMEALR